MRSLAVLLLVAGGLCSVAEAEIISVDPDRYPNGTPITTGTNISAEFPGLTLWAVDDVGKVDGNTVLTLGKPVEYVYARADGLHSTPTMHFGRHASEDRTWGGPDVLARTYLRGDFDSPVGFLQLDFISNDKCFEHLDVGFLEIFDTGMNSLGVFTEGELHGYGMIGTISITRPTADIAYFLASGSPVRGDDVGLDNLKYALEGGPPPVPIPEPFSLLVWAVAVSAGTLSLRFRQKVSA